jgi:GT2 family glycosyltransferase
MYSNKRVAIVIVHYGDNTITLRLVESLEHVVDIVIVDNGGLDKSLYSDSIQILDPKKNLGYLEGFRFAMNRISDNYDWIAIANNDLVLKRWSNEIFYKANQNISMIAPSIKEFSGKELNPHFKHKLSKFKKGIFQLYFKSFYIAYLMRNIKPKIKADKIETSEYNNSIYSPNGAIVFIRKDLFDSIKLESSLSFLYGEEVYFAEMAFRNNRRIFFTDSIIFEHEHSMNTGKGFSKKKWHEQREMYIESRARKYNFFK